MAGFPLNNVTTSAAYSDANTSQFAPAKAGFAVIINNAAVFYTLSVSPAGLRSTATQDLAEAFAPPGRYAFDQTDFLGGKCGAIKFRDGVSGVHAQVTVH